LVPAWHSDHWINGIATSYTGSIVGHGVGELDEQALIDEGVFPVYLSRFRSPMLGFRCCLPRIFGDIVEPLEQKGTNVRASEDAEVLPFLEPAP
jgi:hypothetical protein